MISKNACRHPSQKKAIIWALLAFAALAFQAQAWNNVGHRTIAELVWRKLSQAERRKASDLLKHHPHYKALLTNHVPAGVSEAEWAFLNAAIWPDMVRKPKEGQPDKPLSFTQYDLYPHAIGYPIVWPGYNNLVSVEHFSLGNPNAEQVLSNCLSTLRHTNLSAETRSISLCWVLHLTGDLHQPLHAATIVTPQKPHGDALGGSYFVIGPDGRKVNLHVFWDDLAGINPSYETAARVADEIEHSPELRAENLKEYREHHSIQSWVKESYDYARDFAYARNRVHYAHVDDLNSGRISTEQIPKLKSDYIMEAEQIGRRRIALAAWRLADELKTMRQP
jgi:hypothetical protein